MTLPAALTAPTLTAHTIVTVKCWDDAPRHFRTADITIAALLAGVLAWLVIA